MKKGFVATTTVLLIMAVVMAITTTVTMLSIGSAQGSLALGFGEDAWNLSEGCLEDALGIARESISYTGGTLVRPEGNCTITITKVAGVWTVTAIPLTGEYRRAVQAVVTRTGTGMILTSWKEL